MTKASLPGTAQADALQAEQVRLLYSGLPAAIIINTLLAAILASVQSDAVAPGRIFGWLALIGPILVGRIALALVWRSSGSGSSTVARTWMRLYRISAIATGMAWGAGAALLFPAGDPFHQVTLSFILAGLSAGAVTLLAVDRLSMLGFLVPVLSPLLVRFWLEGGALSFEMGTMVALFMVFIPANAANAGRALHDNFRLRILAEKQEQVMRQSEARLNLAQHLAHVGNWELDLASNKLYWSDEIYRIFEIDRATFGASYEAFLNTVHPDDRAGVDKAYTDSLASHAPYDIVHRLRFEDGRIKYVRERCETQFDADGKAVRSLGTIQDITDQKLAETALKESESRFRFMLENSPIAARITTSATCQVEFANQRYADLINSAREKVIGINPKQYYAHPQDYDDVLEQIGKGERVTNRLIEMIIPNEHSMTKWVLASYLPLQYQNEPAVLGWFYDISDRKAMEEQARHLAYHDPLTGLPNRMLFSDRMHQAIANAKREKGHLALMFIDLDKFKPINDKHGHDVGDLVLKQVAHRIHDSLRESDTVGRIGGDEFVVLLPTIKVEHDALVVAEKIRNALNRPFELAGHSLSISSSTGITIYPEHGTDEKQLIKNADAAMYFAKSAGRDNVQIYRAGMQEVAD